jgi:hypothetical protein
MGAMEERPKCCGHLAGAGIARFRRFDSWSCVSNMDSKKGTTALQESRLRRWQHGEVAIGPSCKTC